MIHNSICDKLNIQKKIRDDAMVRVKQVKQDHEHDGEKYYQVVM
jgi:hypothetical protein